MSARAREDIFIVRSNSLEWPRASVFFHVKSSVMKNGHISRVHNKPQEGQDLGGDENRFIRVNDKSQGIK